MIAKTVSWPLMILFLCLAAHSQDPQSIVERDPFDPDRGREAETEAVEETVEAAPVVDIPILDGTIILGSLKYALLSYTEEGIPVSARVQENETFGGFTVGEIGPNSVKLKSGGEVYNLELYSGKKQQRGGTKAAVKTPTGPVVTTVGQAVESNRKASGKPVKRPSAKPPGEMTPPNTSGPPSSDDRKKGRF